MPDTDVPPMMDTGPSVDAGPTMPRMTFTFVSAALVSPADASVRMNAVISWHGNLRGTSPDGRITFEGVIR
ncbi:MAG: hypothetical protein HY909_27535 [Deltaproteobacteria bacterium]|nr:hypothetical protein [Deltaproteobacteria bacterium]